MTNIIPSLILKETAELWSGFTLNDATTTRPLDNRMVISCIHTENGYDEFSRDSQAATDLSKSREYYKLLEFVFGEEKAAFKVDHSAIFMQGKVLVNTSYWTKALIFKVPSVVANMVSWALPTYSKQVVLERCLQHFSSADKQQNFEKLYYQDRGDETAFHFLMEGSRSTKSQRCAVSTDDLYPEELEIPFRLVDTGHMQLHVNEMLDHTRYISNLTGSISSIQTVEKNEALLAFQKSKVGDSRPFLELFEVTKGSEKFFRVALNIRSCFDVGYDPHHTKPGYSTYYPIRDVSEYELTSKNLTPHQYLLAWQSIFAIAFGDPLKAFDCAQKLFSNLSPEQLLHKWEAPLFTFARCRWIQESLRGLTKEEVSLVVEGFIKDGADAECFRKPENVFLLNKLLEPFGLGLVAS